MGLMSEDLKYLIYMRYFKFDVYVRWWRNNWPITYIEKLKLQRKWYKYEVRS